MDEIKLMYNPNFKVVEFDHFKSEAGLHTFTLSAKELIEQIEKLFLKRRYTTEVLDWLEREMKEMKK